jgi:hypothetical protein
MINEKRPGYNRNLKVPLPAEKINVILTSVDRFLDILRIRDKKKDPYV